MVRFPVAAAANLLPNSAGKRTPALGGCDESLSARTTRPTLSAASMSPNHRLSSFSCLTTKPSFSLVASARVASSRATIGSSEVATTLRKSRRSSSSISASAASARSSHSATRNFGSNCSAMAMRPAAGISSRPSLRASAFCSVTARRTAGMPPRSALSATARWASGNADRAALRWVRPGLRRLAFGRSGSSGGASKRGRRSGRGPRSVRGARSGRDARSVVA